MIPAALSFAPQVILGFLLVVILFQENILVRFPLKLALGTGMGLGISSCLYFFWSLLFDPQHKSFFLLEGALILVLLYLLFHARSKIFTSFSSIHLPPGKLQNFLVWISLLLLVIILINTLLDFYYVTTINPHGWYDTYTIWDYRARMIFRGGAFWLESFSPQVWHADYPLLVPLSTANGWLLLGRENQQVPAFLTVLFSLSLACLLFGTLLQLRDYSQAFLAVILILGMNEFLGISANQLADSPLAYYILGAAVAAILGINNREKRPTLLVICGLFSGLAAWTKNEGVLLLIFSILALCFLKLKSSWREFFTYITHFYAGLALPLAAFLYFKFRLAPPPSDVLSITDSKNLVKNLLDLSRYILITRSFVGGLWSFSLWKVPVFLILPLNAAVLNINRSRSQFYEIIIGFLLVLFLMLVYFVNYLTSPLDLNWYLLTSRFRVLWQIFPTLLLVVFLLVKSPKQVFFK